MKPVVLGVTLIVGGWMAALPGESIHHRVLFDRSHLNLGKAGEFDLIDMEGIVPAGDEGTPRLPAKTVFLLLPHGTAAERVRVTHTETELLDGNYVPLPLQRPGIPGESVQFTGPRRDIYSSAEPYPSRAVKLATSGVVSGYPVAAVLVYPVQYLPSRKKLLFYNSVEFTVDLAVSSRAAHVPQRQTRPGRMLMERLIKGVVHNPEDVDLAGPPLRTGRRRDRESAQTGFNPRTLPSLQGSPVEYLIITSQEMKPAFEVLAEWKTQKGVPAVVRTLEEIKAHTPAGADDAQTLRRFIAEAHEKWGVVWVLLGGDVDVIPARYVEVDESGTERISDLYYGDLDGNWNADGDAVWGERWGDQVDFFFDLFVGRAPVETVEEAEIFVAKTLHYEQGGGDHQNRILYMGEKLWPGDGKYYCERVDAHVSQPWIEKTKLYESDGTENRESVLTAMNMGQNLIFNVSHGNSYRILVGPPGHALEHTDMFTLGNAVRYSLFYNVTCNANDISYDDSFSERFLLNAQGGGVGYIGSTWLDYPSISILQNEEFFKLLFEEDDWRVGSAFARSQLPLVPFTFSHVYRQVYLNYLLLGDPELPVHTRLPAPLVVEAPASIAPGESGLSLTVYDTSGGLIRPVEGAAVCAAKEGEVYVVGLTDASGKVTLQVAPRTPGELTITATGRNHRPFLGTVEVEPVSRPFAYCGGVTVMDSSGGNGDGILNPGEAAVLGISIVNGGGWSLSAGGSSPLRVRLRSPADEVEVLDGTALMEASIDPYDSARVYFSVAASRGAQDGAVVPLHVSVSNREGAWEDTVRLTLRSPALGRLLTRYDKGEGEWGVWVTVVNEGTGRGEGISGKLTLLSGEGIIRRERDDYGTFEPGEIKTGYFRFRPYDDPSSMILGLVLTDRYGETWRYSMDMVAPESPRELNFVPGKESIRLFWVPVDDPDLAGYTVFRSGFPEGPYERILDRPLPRIATYEDRDLEGGQFLWYRISAVDSSGNESVWSDSIGAWRESPFARGWPVAVDTRVRSGPAVVDTDGDGDMEMFMGTLNGTIFVAEETGSTLAPFVRAGGAVWSKPAVDDLDRDGVVEMVVTLWGGAGEPGVQAWKVRDSDKDGTPDPVDGWPPNSSGRSGFISSPVLADVDGDPFLEVLAMDLVGRVYVWEHDGTLKRGWPRVAGHGSGRGHLYPTLAVGNLDGDPELEIVALGGNRSQDLGSIYVWGQADLDTALIFEGPGPFSASPALADLDGDGALEIVALSERHRLYVLEMDGSFPPGWEGGKRVNVVNVRDRNMITPSPAVADLDSDGELEIVVSGKKSVLVWRRDGSLADGFPVTGMELPMSPVLGDVDGDPAIEIVVGAGDRKLYAFNPDGSRVPGWPVSVGAPIVSAPGLGDIDGDGYNDIVWASDDFKIYRMETSGDPSRVPWGTFHHDMANTGLYHYRGIPLAVGQGPMDEGKVPFRFRLHQNFPNPFNSATVIRYALGDNSSMALEVYDLRGRKIRTLAAGPAPRGVYSVSWDGRDDSGTPVGSGVYMIHLRAGPFKASRKMVRIK